MLQFLGWRHKPKLQLSETALLREIPEKYGYTGDYHLEDLQARILELQQLPNRTPLETEELAAADRLLTSLVRAASDNNASVNDTEYPKSVQEAIQSLPIHDADCFPMEWFMDYREPTHAHSVGDIVWARIGETADGAIVTLRAVVVGRGIEMDDVYYVLAAYTEQAETAYIIPRDFGEHELSIEDPTPKARLKVVQ